MPDCGAQLFRNRFSLAKDVLIAILPRKSAGLPGYRGQEQSISVRETFSAWRSPDGRQDGAGALSSQGSGAQIEVIWLAVRSRQCQAAQTMQGPFLLSGNSAAPAAR
jgi:hypothetical protein